MKKSSSIKKLRINGRKSYDDIAKIIGCSKSSVQRVCEEILNPEKIKMPRKCKSNKSMLSDADIRSIKLNSLRNRK